METIANVVESAIRYGSLDVCRFGLELIEQLEEFGQLGYPCHAQVAGPNIYVVDRGVVLGESAFRRRLEYPERPANSRVIGRFAEYMSLEQVYGLHLDVRTDVFSLGVVLWELATGRRLFARESDIDAMLAIASWEGAPSDPAMEPELARVLQRALSPAREDRFQNLAAMREALENCLRTLEETTCERY